MSGVSGCARGGYGFGPIPQGPSGGVPAPVGAGAPPPPPACRSALKTVPDPQAPHGLYVWIDSLSQTKNQPAIFQYLPKDANLCGASIVVFWSAVDRGPAASPQYDFAAVESAIKPWASAGRLVNLLFANVNETGTSDTATPAWVLAQTGANKVNSVACPGSRPRTECGTADARLLGDGIREAVSRVRQSRHRSVRRRSPHRVHAFRRRSGRGGLRRARRRRRVLGKMASIWLVGAFLGDVQHRASELRRESAFEGATTRRPQYVRRRRPPYDVPDAVAAAAAAAGIGFGTENLGSGSFVRSSSTPCKDVSPVPYWCAAFDAHAGKVPFNSRRSRTRSTLRAEHPAASSAPPYGIYNHAQIFELYPQDWLTADDSTYASYAAHHGAWSKALTSAAALLGDSP